MRGENLYNVSTDDDLTEEESDQVEAHDTKDEADDSNKSGGEQILNIVFYQKYFH